MRGWTIVILAAAASGGSGARGSQAPDTGP